MIVYVSKPTYYKLKRIAAAKEWSLQKVIRDILDRLPEEKADLP